MITAEHTSLASTCYVACSLIFSPQKMKSTLQDMKWEQNSSVTRFQYADGQHQIRAHPETCGGPGWNAVIDGQHAVGLLP